MNPTNPGELRPVLLTDDMRRKFNSVSTATLAGRLQERGILNSFLQDLKPTRPGQRMLGYAHTLRYVPKAPEFDRRRPFNAQRAAIESIEPEEVLVIEARGERHAGTLGDIYAMRVAQRGGAGVVTDGALRDTHGIAAIDMPVYHLSSHGAMLGRLHSPLDHQIPVVCANVCVFPGDIVVGDEEGVVVVPARLAAEIADEAHAVELREEWGLQRVSAGESIEGTFPISDQRRPEFEAWLAERPD